jgi:hypothetical protein
MSGITGIFLIFNDIKNAKMLKYESILSGLKCVPARCTRDTVKVAMVRLASTPRAGRLVPVILIPDWRDMTSCTSIHAYSDDRIHGNGCIDFPLILQPMGKTSPGLIHYIVGYPNGGSPHYHYQIAVTGDIPFF